VEEYMANFKMLIGRTGFSEAALEDVDVQDSPVYLLKVYSQTSLLLA